MLKFELKPYDVLFFGSGKPFNLNVQEASSIFPPFTTTIAGAISGKISSEKGIDSKRVIKKIYGPFLEKNEQILFIAPFDILKEKKKGEESARISKVYLEGNFRLLNPLFSNIPVQTSYLLWPKEKDKDLETFNGFIKLSGLQKWVNGLNIDKDDLVYRREIFEFEPRVGIKIDYSKNVVKEEDAVYRIDFVRLKDDVRLIFFVEFNYDSELKDCGLDSEDKIYNFFESCEIKVLKLGGEMRSVTYEVKRENISDKLGFEKPNVGKDDIIKILYLTHGFLEENNAYEIINGSIKSVNLGVRSKNYGTKLKRGVSAGSVIYAKVADEKRLDEIWMNPNDGEFIGSNLRIYTKYREE